MFSQPPILINHGYWIAAGAFKSPPCAACTGCDRGCEPIFRALAFVWLTRYYNGEVSYQPCISWWLLFDPQSMAGLCPRLEVSWCGFDEWGMFPLSNNCKLIQVYVWKCCLMFLHIRISQRYCSTCTIFPTCHTLLLNTRIPLLFNTQWW